MLTTLRYRLAALGPWPRRLAALACLAMAAATALSGRDTAGGAAPVDTRVVVAAHDLGAGSTLRSDDLTVHRLPRSAAPPGAAADPSALTGRRVAGPIRTGEAVTSSRLAGRGLTDSLPYGQTALAVAVADTHVADFIHSGDHVDVVAAPNADAATPSDVTATGSTVVAAGTSPPPPDAHALLVLAVLPARAGTSTAGNSGGDDTAEVIVAADAPVARSLAAKQPNGPFTVLLCRS